MRPDLGHFSFTVVMVAVLALAGCGGGSGDFLSGGAGPQAQTSSLLLRFDFGVAPRSESARFRLPSSVTTLQVLIFGADGDQLLARELGRVDQQRFEGLPTGRVLVRIIASDASGILGYFDRFLTIGSSEAQVLFDTLIAGSPPPPNFAGGNTAQAARLAFLTHPRSTQVGVAQTVEVVALAGDGERAISFSGPVTLSVVGGTLASNSTASFSGGVARFEVVIGSPGNSLTLLLASDLSDVFSLPFNVSEAGGNPTGGTTGGTEGSGQQTPVATSLRFVNGSGSASPDQPLQPPIQVEVLDQFGQRLTSATDLVSLSFSAGSVFPGVQLGGTTTRPASQGVATFGDLTISTVGVYTLAARSGQVLSAVSGSIFINATGPGDPEVELDDGTLTLDVNDSPELSPGATVKNSVGGGTLSFSLTGAVTDARFTAPGAPVIGTVVNNASSTMSVNLFSTATPDEIQSFLRGVKLSGTTQGTGTARVDLVDGRGRAAVTAPRNFTITALNLTVGPTGNHATIGAALNEVRNSTGAMNSTITVAAGDFTAEGYLDVGVSTPSGDPDLVGLTLKGAAFGQSAGIVPDLARSTLTKVAGFQIYADGVNIDGFDLDNSGGTRDTVDIRNGVGVSVRNCVITRNGGMSACSVRKENSTISRCLITGSSIGFFITNLQDLTITDNRITSTSTGMSVPSFATGGSEDISNNGFTTSARVSAGVDLILSGNSFEGSTIAANSGVNVNARGNWWGQSIGPMPAQTAGAGTVDTTNFLMFDPHSTFP